MVENRSIFIAITSSAWCRRTMVVALALAFAAAWMGVVFAAQASDLVRAAAIGATCLCFSILGWMLRPIAALERELEAQAEGRAGSGPTGAQRMSANLALISERLAALAMRAERHPVSRLPVRDELLATVSQDIGIAAGRPMLLGIIRFANYDQMVAFDAGLAERILLTFSQRLAKAVDGARVLAHVDRDCFAIWFGSIETGAAAAELQTIGYVASQEINDSHATIAPDIQIGSAIYPLDTDEAASLLSRAFVSLARPQRTADGGIAFFARPSSEHARRRFSLEQDLRRAVRRGEFQLHYQPFVDLKLGRVVGAEALLRWCSHDRGPISPAHFVHILEEVGLMHEVGLWALNAACKQVRDWSNSAPTDMRVAVNLSAQQARDASLKSVLERTLAAHRLQPSQIELELTETAATEDAQRTRILFAELQEMGFSLAIDDFGSGYSSLSYLKTLPFNKLKIDREFVTNVDQRADSRAICGALIELTRGLGLSVLAEGVERAAEVDVLHKMGCTAFQGFYFSQPLPASEFTAALANEEWLARIASPVRRQQQDIRRGMV